MASPSTLTLTQRSPEGDRPLHITISRDVVLHSEVDYDKPQPPMYGWMRWDKVPIDWDTIIEEAKSEQQDKGG